MKKLLFKNLVIILSIVVAYSCDHKYDVLEYYPLEINALNSDEQTFILDTEGDIFEIWFNYGEGDSDIFESMNGVEHASTGLYVLYYDGGWFKADARKNPRQLVVNIEANYGTTYRSIEMYVDVFGPDGHHPGQHNYDGTGYHVILSQAPFRE